MFLIQPAAHEMPLCRMDQIGFFFGANRKVVLDTRPAAGGEAATRGHVNQVGHRAGDYIQALLEFPRIGMEPISPCVYG